MDSPVRRAYEEARRYVGNVEETSLGTVRSRDFQRFAIASGDSNPVFFDDEEARRWGYPGAVAPPLFLSSVMGWGPGPAEKDLVPDGTASEDMGSLPLHGLRLMGAGQDLEFVNPVTDGTTVTVETTIDDIDLKEGKSGPLLFIKLQKRYVDDRGRTLVVCRESFIGR